MVGDPPFLLGPGQGCVSIRRRWVSSGGGWFHTQAPSQMPRNRSHTLGTSPASSRILSQVRSFVLSSRVDLAVHGPATSLDLDTLQTPLSGHAVDDDVRSSPVNVRVSFPSPAHSPGLCSPCLHHGHDSVLQESFGALGEPAAWQSRHS